MGLAGFFIFLWLVFNFFRCGLFPVASNAYGLETGSPEVKSILQASLWGGAAFFIHGLVDFDFYAPNLTFSAFFLMGVVGVLNARKSDIVLFKKTGSGVLYLLLAGVVFLGLAYHQSNYILRIFTMEKIDNLISGRDFKKAGEELEGLLKTDEFNPRLHFEKARLSEFSFSRERKKAAISEAIYEYSLASCLNPHRAGYHFSLARLYWALREDPRFLKKAVSEFELAHQAYPAKKEYRQDLETLRQYLGRI
jgi:hypothetical protein